jgi:type IV pilus assembly protein PilC
MPYYKWRGVDLTARIQKGTHFAPSESELDASLLQRDIALLNCTVIVPRIIKPISLLHISTFFGQLSTLLKAGIPLPQALRLIGERIAHRNLGLMVQEMGSAVAQGIPFDQILNTTSHLFSSVMIATIATGLETGNLPQALDLLNEYMVRRITIEKRTKAALLMPFITFAFFLLIAAIMMIVLVPRFAQLLQSMHKELPSATQRLLMISNFLASWYGWIIIGGGIFASAVLYRMSIYYLGKRKQDELLLTIPGIRNFIVFSEAGAYFQTLGMLVSGGMQVVPAMQLAQKACSNEIIRDNFSAAAHDVAGGYQVSHALSARAQLISSPEIISMIAIGEETSTLGPVFVSISQEYYDRLYKKLELISSLVQPILMVCLGLLITALILAIYTPVFSLSYAV